MVTPYSDYVIRTDTSLLTPTTSPTTNYDFSESIMQETGGPGLTYLLYFNEQVMDDWSYYAYETTTDFPNYSNVGNYDGKALRIQVDYSSGLGAGDVACLADHYEVSV